MRTLAFHQKFKLDRERLSSLVRSISEEGVGDKKSVAMRMSVNAPVAEGFLGWLLKTGLGNANKGKYMLTPVGKTIATHDPHLSDEGTLWILHYYLSTEHEERAEVWHRCFNQFLNPGMTFTRTDLQAFVERTLEGTSTNSNAIAEDSKELIKCYTEAGGLGKLRLITEVGKGEYQAGLTELPHPNILAFMLFDSWQQHFPDNDTVRMSQVHQEPEMLGRTLVSRREQLVQALYDLQGMGLVNIVDSQHEPVTRRYRDEPIKFLEAYYATL